MCEEAGKGGAQQEKSSSDGAEEAKETETGSPNNGVQEKGERVGRVKTWLRKIRTPKNGEEEIIVRNSLTTRREG